MPTAPLGTTLFNDNQVRLLTAQHSTVSQVIQTQDDVSFNDNQSEVLAGDALAVNTVLSGISIRAGANRFQEPIDFQRQCFSQMQAPPRRSLIAVAPTFAAKWGESGRVVE